VFKKKSYTIALVISLLVHLLVLITYRPLVSFSRLLEVSSAADANTALENLPLEFELVETPDDAAVEKPPDNAQFLSDKNARAQDQQTDANLKEGLPYSEGQTAYKIFAGGEGVQPVPVQNAVMPTPQPTEPQETQDEQQNEEPTQSEEAFTEQELALIKQEPVRQYSHFSREMLAGGAGKSSRRQSNFSDDVNWDNREFDAKDLGGVSLSTYAWDYAPYIFYMKKRLRDHIYPPPAFMRMGAISGQVVVKFRVYPDGHTSDAQVLGYDGHKALVETSVNAVKASSPFRPLPKDFPEKYLELTWTFIYSITQ